MSPRRTRSGPSAQKKYTNHNSYRADDEEDEDEDEIVRSPRSKRKPARFREDGAQNGQSRRGRRSQQLRDEEEDDDDDEEDEVAITPKGKRRILQMKDDDQDEDEEEKERKPKGKGRGRGSRRTYNNEVENHDHDDEEDDPDYQVAPRRSNRERKMIYSTMSDNLIGNCYSSK